jgi:hypothetical protein
MSYDELKAFINSCSENTGIDENKVYRSVHDLDHNVYSEYTIIRDSLQIWQDAIKYAQSNQERMNTGVEE